MCTKIAGRAAVKSVFYNFSGGDACAVNSAYGNTFHADNRVAGGKVDNFKNLIGFALQGGLAKIHHAFRIFNFLAFFYLFQKYLRIVARIKVKIPHSARRYLVPAPVLLAWRPILPDSLNEALYKRPRYGFGIFSGDTEKVSKVPALRGP